MRVASTAVSMVPWPDIMTTGIVSWPLAAHSLSSVMPSVSGIQMSSSTRSGRCALAQARARLRVLGKQHLVALLGEDLREQLADADLVIDDHDLRHRRYPDGIIEVMRLSPAAGRRSPTRPRRRWLSIEIEPRCSSTIFFTIASPRPGAARLGRHVRLEDPRHELLGKAIAIVGHRELHLVAGELRCAPRSPARGAARSRCASASCAFCSRLCSTCRICGRVGPHRGQARREPGADRRLRMLVQRKHLAHQRIEIHADRMPARGSARVVAKIVHHRFERGHLVHDRAACPRAQRVRILRRAACRRA